MPRRREVPKRIILADPKFGSEDVSKFINVVMLHGKKAVAERIVYGAFEFIEKKANKNPIEIFHQALTNAKPAVEVKAVAWAVQTIRCPSKYGHPDVLRSRCVGCARLRKNVVRNQ